MKRRNLSSSPALTRKQKVAAENRNGYMIMAVCVGVIATFVLLGVTVFREVKVDPKTGCLLNHETPKAHTVILVDETDRLSRDELAFAKQLINNEYHWLPVGGRLTVRNIVADPDLAEDIIVCRMDDGKNELGLVRNKKKVTQDFQRIAGARLDELYTALRTAPTQKYSPILEFISATFDRPNFGSNVKQRRLVVFSDMAQHSDLFSQYGRAAEVLPKAVAAELRRNMSGVSIRIQYVRRRELTQIQGEKHKQFWETYLRGMGADEAWGHDLLVGEDPSREIYSDD